MWVYHGLWCKVLARCADQLAVVADLPFVPRPLARAALTALGLTEVALAAWVLSRRAPREAALAETALLALMNGGGLLWSRRHIAHPTALLAENVAFLALVWWTARNDAATASPPSRRTRERAA